ncbi:hypothetical protein ACXDF8_07360 [Mycolicibacterium sp. CBM1]
MATNTTVWIVVAVIAALIVIAALAWIARNRHWSYAEKLDPRSAQSETEAEDRVRADVPTAEPRTS